MGYGNCVLAYGTPENREVLGEGGILYGSVEELRSQLQQLADDPARRLPYRDRALNRAARYSWETVTDQYEVVFRGMLTGSHRQA